MRRLTTFVFIFPLCCIFLFSIKGYTQPSTSAIDSIKVKYQESNDAVSDDEFQALIDLAYDYSDAMQFDACVQLTTFILTLVEQDPIKQSTLYHVQGYNHARQRKNGLAVEDYLKSAAYRRAAGEHILLYKTLSNLGKVYYDLGQYVKAIDTYKEALDIATKLNDKNGKALALTGIAIVLSDQKKYDIALQYLHESTENYRHIQDSTSIGRNYFDMGEIKYLMKQPDSALHYFNLSLAIGESTGDHLVISYNLHRIGSIYMDQANLVEAERYFKQGLALREKINYPLEIALSHLDLSKLFYLTQRYDQAYIHASKMRALSQQTDFLKGQALAAELLSDIYEKQHNYSQALIYQREFKQLNDSLFSIEKNRQIEDFNTEIQIEKRTNILKIKHAKQKNELLLLSFALGGIALLITAYFLRLKARNKRKYEYQIKQQEVEAEKQTLLGVYEERKRISRDVHDDLGSSISGIKMLSEMIYDQTTDPLLKQSHAKLLNMQTEITEKVRDIIWMLNYENNTLDKLVWYCRRYSEKIMESFAVKFTTTTPHPIPIIPLTDEVRKNYFLCVKEALNNILKHAKASQVELIFNYEDQIFSISIQDNGRGFDKNATKGFKNGLKNMTNRMHAIDGEFVITSTTQGTRVVFSSHIPQNRN